MDTITNLEQEYQNLWHEFRGGHLDEPSFLQAVDQLSFQDRWGRYWMIGARSGKWYYYDGRAWRQANPQQAERLSFQEEGRVPRPAPTSVPPRSKLSSRLLLGGLALLALVLMLLIWPSGGGFLIAQSGSPVSTPTEEPESSGSTIFGTITDLSTDQRGAGFEIVIDGNRTVQADEEGQFEITGLEAGEYAISLDLQGQGEPEKETVYVSVNGVDSETIELNYYSEPEPLPTDTPQAKESLAESPPALPDSGASLEWRPFLIIGLGLLLMLGGAVLGLTGRWRNHQ